MARSHVPFGSLWSMAIDVPYSLVLRDGDLAWSCGQLALGPSSEVLAANDLVAQSSIVCGYIMEILARADLPLSRVRRLYLYHVHTGDGDRDRMLELFRSKFGHNVLLDTIAVPHFYYDGIVLEVEVYCALADSEIRWVTVSVPSHKLDRLGAEISAQLNRLGVHPASILTEHWIAPSRLLADVAGVLDRAALVGDAGAVLDGGEYANGVTGLLSHIPGRSSGLTRTRDDNTVRIVTREHGALTWMQSRCVDGTLGLVAQTEVVMAGIAATLGGLGLDFADVAKSTTHYTGGNSAEELHDNMSIRNAYYARPGPASTGLPVFGFADNASRVVVDIWILRRER